MAKKSKNVLHAGARHQVLRPVQKQWPWSPLNTCPHESTDVHQAEQLLMLKVSKYARP